MTRKPFFPIIIIFSAIALMLIILRYEIKNGGNVFDVIFVGNLVLYMATALSFRLYIKAISANNTHAFLKMVYSGMFLKMIICIAAVLIYAFGFKPVSKYAILSFFALYFIYTFIEIKIVMRLNKEKKNA